MTLNTLNLQKHGDFPSPYKFVNFFSKYSGLFLLILAALTLCSFWPGSMRSDSLSQLGQATVGTFTDHHPPIMAFYWSYLNKIYPGPGLMFVTHSILFWVGCYYFSKAVAPFKTQWMIVLIALFPQIIIFQPFILKDIGFVNCYFFVIALLTYQTILEERPSLLKLALMILVLFYGTAVKYQAIFILPVICLWISYLYCKNRFSFVSAGIFYLAFYVAITLFNSAVSEKSHSWQFVKLYDLAGISLKINKPVFPDYILQSDNFSMKRLEENYTPRRVDELVFPKNPVLAKATTDEQRDILWNTWWEAVKTYPLSYLSHRSDIFMQQLSLSFVKSRSEIKGDLSEISPLILKAADVLDGMSLTNSVKLLTSFTLYFPIQILYFIFGLYHRRNALGRILSFMNGIGLLLLGTLFIFSMAAEARYIYLSICCFHFSHPFVYALWRQKKNS